MAPNQTSPYVSGAVLEAAVGLLIVKTENAVNAMTVSFFSEVAHHPTALWVAVSPKSYTHLLLERSRRFSIAVLNQNQKQIAIACGFASGRDLDKCARLDLYESQGGFLFLSRALASTGCVLRESVPLGDHTLFIGDIMEAEIDSRSSHLRQLLLADL